MKKKLITFLAKLYLSYDFKSRKSDLSYTISNPKNF